jgi:hypothetical protein
MPRARLVSGVVSAVACKRDGSGGGQIPIFREHLVKEHNIGEATDRGYDISRFLVKSQKEEDMLHVSGAASTHWEITAQRTMSPGFMATTGLRTGLPETGGGSSAAAARPYGVETTLDTHTDSGYGTHGTRTIACSSGYPHTASGEAVHEDDKDTRTIYSDTTSLQDPRIDDYVAAFADELANALPPDFCREELERIEDSLPDILEAFAGRIGYQAPGNLERKLKYIVHRYRM